MQQGTQLAKLSYEEGLSDFLLDLYETAVNQDHWQVFLDRLCALTTTVSGSKMAVDPESGNATLAGRGLDFNPEILHLYNELLRPNNLGYMTLLSSGRPDEACPIPLWRSPNHGPMDAASIHFLRMLLPHIRTALRLRNKMLACRASEHFSESALDVMATAVFLVTSNGQVRHMNKLAAAHLQQGDGLRLSNNKLSASDLNEDARLDLLIAGATAKSKNSWNAVLGGAMKISSRNREDALHVTVTPTPANLKAMEFGPCALAFVYDPSSLPKSRAPFMQQLYALTPTEARLADLLLQGIDVRAAAERLQTTLETTRFHLKRVLAKTGTGRQTELMRLMLSLPGQ